MSGLCSGEKTLQFASEKLMFDLIWMAQVKGEMTQGWPGDGRPGEEDPWKMKGKPRQTQGNNNYSKVEDGKPKGNAR